MRSLDIAATGMLAQQTNVDVISQNLANMTTTAYKEQVPAFVDLFYQNITRQGATSNEPGAILPSGKQLGLGVRTSTISRIHNQGVLENTGNQLDVAISGRGYFVIELPNGIQGFTRDGTFKLDQDGQLVTNSGNIVSPGITVPNNAREITISPTGVVEATIQGQVNSSNLGQLDIAVFVNENGLDAQGNNIYLETLASGTPLTAFAGEEGYGTLIQGYLESSNVDAVKEITGLITAQRGYEMNSKVIKASDEMMSVAAQLRN